MDAYQGYREPPLARSPPERTSWGGRDDGYRPTDRAEPRDNFYRGRSPGMFLPFLFDIRGLGLLGCNACSCKAGDPVTHTFAQNIV